MVGRWVKLKCSLDRPDYIALHDVTAACEMFQSASRSRDGGDPNAAKCFQGFEDFQNVRWLGAGELFGEIGRHEFVVAARLQARCLKLTGRKAPVVVLLKNQWGQLSLIHI